MRNSRLIATGTGGHVFGIIYLYLYLYIYKAYLKSRKVITEHTMSSYTPIVSLAVPFQISGNKGISTNHSMALNHDVFHVRPE